MHTGQHYDDNMSKVFFDQLEIPNPRYNLNISGGSHGLMTGIEFVKDRTTKTPMDPSFGLSVQKVAMDNGVMLRASGPNVLLSPPLIISEADVDVILNAIDVGLTATS